MPPTTPAQRRMNKNNTTGVAGVYYNSHAQAYCVQRIINGKRKTLGYRATLAEAQELRDSIPWPQSSPAIIYLPAPYNDRTAGFRQTLAILLANGKAEEAATVQAAIEIIEAQQKFGADKA